MVRVIFDESKTDRPLATGVQYRLSSGPQSKTAPDGVIKAKKLVVIAAGALGTPQILERSGIGNPQVLKKAGIEVAVALPGVGENYQDHICIRCPYESSLDPSETLDGILSGRQDITQAMEEENPILGWNGVGKL